jgi:hypothetical protein
MKGRGSLRLPAHSPLGRSGEKGLTQRFSTRVQLMIESHKKRLGAHHKRPAPFNDDPPLDGFRAEPSTTKRPAQTLGRSGSGQGLSDEAVYRGSQDVAIRKPRLPAQGDRQDFLRHFNHTLRVFRELLITCDCDHAVPFVAF